MNKIARKLRSLEVRGWRIFFRLRKGPEKYQMLLENKFGLEIGGPTNLFMRNELIPIYPVVRQMDGCSFAVTTLWHNGVKSGQRYSYGENRTGQQFICEATHLEHIKPEQYDFVISSNCIEHIANPLKAIKEWLRVIKNDGILMMVVPRKESNFDHKRSMTPVNHIVSDYEKDTKEDDLTHLEEILRLHDLSMDIASGNFEQFKERSLKNFENRALHHHVFDLWSLRQVANYFHLRVLLVDNIGSDYVFVVAK